MYKYYVILYALFNILNFNTKSQHEILTRLFSGIKYKNGLVTFCLSEQAQQITQKQKFLFDYTRI